MCSTEACMMGCVVCGPYCERKQSKCGKGASLSLAVFGSNKPVNEQR